jgi:competence protein ComEC
MRYGFPFLVFLYSAILIVLHIAGYFPTARSQDIAQLIGQPVVTIEGTMADLPVTRWNQTRFVLQGVSVSPSGYRGNVAVTLGFPRPDLAPGDHLRLRGWLTPPRAPAGKRMFDEIGYWGSQGVYALFKVWSPESLDGYRPVSRWSPLAWTWGVRQRFCAFWQSVLPEDEASLLIGLTIGGRGVLAPEFKTQCIRAGVYHIVVVSGQNVAVVIALGLWGFRRMRLRRRWLWIVALPPILFYTELTGADPPVLRASIMAIYALLSAALQRDPPRFYGLSVSVGVLLLFWPESLFGASFQLSFAATAAILIGFAVLPDRGKPTHVAGRWFWDAVKACLVVHLGVWPVLVFYFHQLSLSGILAPFTVYPLATLSMIVGLLLGAVGVVAPVLVPTWAIWPLHHLLRLIVTIISTLAHWSYAALPVIPLKEGGMVLYYAGLFGILFLSYRRQHYAQTNPPLFMHRPRL